jgi:hypothetical protein
MNTLRRVAVNRFGGMQKMRSIAGRGKRGGELLANVPGLAHAGNDQIAFEAVDHANRTEEIRVELLDERSQSAGLGSHYLAAQPQDFRFGKGRERVC